MPYNKLNEEISEAIKEYKDKKNTIEKSSSLEQLKICHGKMRGVTECSLFKRSLERKFRKDFNRIFEEEKIDSYSISTFKLNESSQAQPGSSSKISKWFKKAEGLVTGYEDAEDEKGIVKASRIYDKILSIEPNNVEAYYKKGLCISERVFLKHSNKKINHHVIRWAVEADECFERVLQIKRDYNYLLIRSRLHACFSDYIDISKIFFIKAFSLWKEQGIISDTEVPEEERLVFNFVHPISMYQMVDAYCKREMEEWRSLHKRMKNPEIQEKQDEKASEAPLTANSVSGQSEDGPPLKRRKVIGKKVEVEASSSSSVATELKNADPRAIEVSMVSFKPKVLPESIQYDNKMRKKYQPEIIPSTSRISTQFFSPSKLPSEPEPNTATNNPLQIEVRDNSYTTEIGNWGEKFVYYFLIHFYQNNVKYKVSTINKDDAACIIIATDKENRLITLEIRWLNKNGEARDSCDIRIKKQIDSTSEKERFIEVKSTASEEDLHIATFSGNQIATMREFGKRYSIFSVTKAGTRDANLVKIKNPWQLFMANQLLADTINFKLR